MLISFFQIFAGIVFLTSAISKAIYTGSFVLLIEQYGFEVVSPAAPIIIIAEAILGIGLIFHIYSRFMALASLLLTMLFTIAYAYAYWFNDITDCGCFGVMHLNMSPTFTIIRNIMLLLMLYVVFRKTPFNSTVAYWKLLTAAILIPAISFITGFTYFDQIPNTNNRTNHFVHKPLHETPLKQHVQHPKQKTLVFCFSFGCRHCLNSIGNLLLYRQHVDTIIALALDESLIKQEFLQYLSPGFNYSNITFEQMHKITEQFPTTFFIKNDTIVYQHVGFLPSPILLKHVIDNFNPNYSLDTIR